MKHLVTQTFAEELAKDCIDAKGERGVRGTEYSGSDCEPTRRRGAVGLASVSFLRHYEVAGPARVSEDRQRFGSVLVPLIPTARRLRSAIKTRRRWRLGAVP